MRCFVIVAVLAVLRYIGGGVRADGTTNLECFWNQASDEPAKQAICPEGANYCYQNYISNGETYDVTFGCSKEICKHCKKPRCLLSYSPKSHVMCCNYPLCNADLITLPHPPKALMFSWRAEFVPFLFVVAMLLLFALCPFFLAWRINREKSQCVENDYNLPIDEQLLLSDDETAFTHMTGRSSLDGCLHTLDFRAAITSTMYDKTEKMPVPDSVYPSVSFGEYATHRATGFDRAIIEKRDPSSYEGVLFRMIEQGPGYFPIHAYELIDLLEALNIVLKAEAPLIELPPDVVVVGDLRGRYCDLMRWLQLHGYPPKRRYLFLGGIIDNANPDSLETFTLIAAMKVAMPYDVYMLRGATESVPYMIRRRFPKVLCNAFSLMFERVCLEMPMCATIGGRILAVHSGICKKMSSIERLRRREGPLNMGIGKMARASIFNVPRRDVDGYSDIPGSSGQYFGEDALRICAKLLNIELFIRSRSVAPKGHFFFARPLMLSIWSANCSGCMRASTVYVDAEMRVSIHSLMGLPQHDTKTFSTVIHEPADAMKTQLHSERTQSSTAEPGAATPAAAQQPAVQPEQSPLLESERTQQSSRSPPAVTPSMKDENTQKMPSGSAVEDVEDHTATEAPSAAVGKTPTVTGSEGQAPSSSEGASVSYKGVGEEGTQPGGSAVPSVEVQSVDATPTGAALSQSIQ